MSNKDKEDKIQEYTRKITIELHGQLKQEALELLVVKPGEEKPFDRT